MRQTPLDQLFFLVARIVVHLLLLVCRIVYSNLKLDARLISPRRQYTSAAAPGAGLTGPALIGQVYQLTGMLPCPL